MGYFQVRYDSRVINYDRKLFIRLATGSADSGVPHHEERGYVGHGKITFICFKIVMFVLKRRK